ncbi:MAG: protein kinase [Planctomycetaceae bacterium]
MSEPIFSATTEHQPERIGPYRIERRLGAGGMGTVYLGRHVDTGHEAAVKVLPASMARETGFVARFTREIDAMRQLKSPHIVELYENGVDDGTYFYAMEYVDGETLTQRLRREKRIPWRDVIDIGVQICRALKSAHNSGIVHRDLKPSNLLLGKDGVVKLTDFGVAQVFAGGKLTITGGMIGTAEYMSPEQAAGQRATKRSDIYSLGAVLYVMLTGRPPFIGDTAMAIAQKHRFNQFDSPRRIVPEIPHWLDEIVCQCLEKKPEDRIPDAYVLSLRLAEVPRKVDYVKGNETFDFQNSQLAEEDTQSSTIDRPAPAAEIGGTLMRDLMRAQVEAGAAQSPLQKAFDNTWFLAALLALVIVGGVLWHRSKQVTPEELFARGVEFMGRPRGAAWDSARDDVFQPLLAQDGETWEPRVRPYLDQIAAYEAERELRGSDYRRATRERTDVERLLLKGLDERDSGQLVAAEHTFAALSALLDGTPDQERWQRVARQFLADVHMQLAAAEETGRAYALLKSALARAAKLDADGQRDEARTIWRGALELYHDDPGAQALLEDARRGLQSTDVPSAVPNPTP